MPKHAREPQRTRKTFKARRRKNNRNRPPATARPR
jgi:hypothetical protein